MSFENTLLWKAAFSSYEDDVHAKERELLKTQLLSMRHKVIQLISHIPADCKNLTVHDITHLDALWSSAQEICGDDFTLNPAEAFVLGAAFLTHDAGLTTLAYPKGRAGLTETTLWDDISASSASSPDEILFEVLRKLHAEQAAQLCLRSWSIPNGDHIYLIDDPELRMAYGELIGRIAHSHHWNSDRIQTELSTHTGGSHTMPSDWTINECKLACIIRCADAAQIDRTRAPMMLYAALGPQGYSGQHWLAQNKLNRPTLRNDAIHLNSSQTFLENEAEAWWVAYDLAKILDQELRSANAILTDIGVKTFAAQRVAGADSPGAFSKYVKTSRWRPIDASVRVSDPLKIARTLGGRNLYGKSKRVAFRELIQNSTDAIRARRSLNQQGREFGKIIFTVDDHPSDNSKCLIFIDDNGIGMSERVLSTTLVDFGRSFWSSSILQEEFPGLNAKRVRHIGKFGIGFFSVFEVSQHVKVASRRYDFGLDDVKILEFRGLASRPLLREANRNDIPNDFNTRITLEVDKSLVSNVFPQPEEETWIHNDRYYVDHGHIRIAPVSLMKTVKGMCAFLDVTVEFSDLRNGDSFKHNSDIYGKSSKELIDELPIHETAQKSKYFDPVGSMQAILDATGDSYGRAALDIDVLLEGRTTNRGYYSTGGIISETPNGSLRSKKGVKIPFYGVVEGETERAARDISSVLAPQEAVHSWLDQQISNIDTSVLRTSEIMEVSSFYLLATGDYANLPFAFHLGDPKKSSDIYDVVKKLECIYLPVSWRYDAWPEVMGYNALRPEFFESPLDERVIILGSSSERLLEEDLAKELKKKYSASMDRSIFISKYSQGRALVNIIESAWQKECSFRFTRTKIFNTNIASLMSDRWVLAIEKSPHF